MSALKTKTGKNSLVELLMSSCSVENGYFLIDGREIEKKIKVFLKNSGLNKEEAKYIFMFPDESFGPFSELPDVLKRSMATSAAFFDQEYCLTNLSQLRNWALKPVWKLGNIFISAGAGLNEQINKNEISILNYSLELLVKIFSRLGFLLTKGSLSFSKNVLKSSFFCKFYKRPFLYALWEYLEVDIKHLCFSYIESIPIHPALGLIYKSSGSMVENTIVVGLDLVPSSNKLYFIEANFNIGYSPERLDIYEGNDPLGYNLVMYAVEKKYDHIIIYGRSVVGQVFDKKTALIWEKIAENNGCTLKVIDYQFSGLINSREKSIEILTPTKGRTLNILLRAPVSSILSTLISEKGNLEEQIEVSNKKSNRESHVYVPRRLSFERSKKKLQTQNVFPNVIVKHKRKDRGEGIEIFNTDAIPLNYLERDYLVNEFIKPDCLLRYDGKRKEQYVYKYRSQILLTTNGPVYLGAHRIRSINPIPHALQFGKISDINPYIANHSLGAEYEKTNQEEDELCKKVSNEIGGIITNFILKKYDIHSGF